MRFTEPINPPLVGYKPTFSWHLPTFNIRWVNSYPQLLTECLQSQAKKTTW